MSDRAERDYERIKAYLLARIQSEIDREYHPERLSLVRGAGVDALGAVAFAMTGSPGDYEDSVDEIALYAARKAMGLQAEPPRLSPVPAPDLLAGLQTHADAYAEQLVKQERAAETQRRSSIQSPSGEKVDVREIVRQETAAFHRTMHRGVWRDGVNYEQGVMVTQGGAVWSSQRDGPKGKPGSAAPAVSGWLMIVKK